MVCKYPSQLLHSGLFDPRGTIAVRYDVGDLDAGIRIFPPESSNHNVPKQSHVPVCSCFSLQSAFPACEEVDQETIASPHASPHEVDVRILEWHHGQAFS